MHTRKRLEKIKRGFIIATVFCLLGLNIPFATTIVNAASNPKKAPVDWAFDESSRGLNDAIIEQYPGLDNGNGYVTKTAAMDRTGEIYLPSGAEISGSMNGIENFTSVTAIYLGDTNLSGEIPEEIGNIRNLKFLSLGKNHLSGEIPKSIGKLSNLQILDLSTNQLSGEIPREIGNLRNILSLNLSSNKLSGEIPTEIGNLVNLRYLYLGKNQLSGEIPVSIANLSKLTSFVLSYNHFTSIPKKLYDYAMTMSDQGTYVHLCGQTYTEDQPKPIESNKDYEFTGLPIYEQILSYGGTIQYTLQLPDGTSKTITPISSNGKVRISGNEITQVGNYSLTATVDGTRLYDSVYKMNFKTVNPITFQGAKANGKKDVETSTKISVSLSKVPEIGELTKADIKLTAKSEAIKALNMGKVTALGAGQYEIEITGDWEEGSIVDVTLNKEGVLFTSSVQSAVLHKAVPGDKDSNNNNANQKDTRIMKSKTPLTGDINNKIAIEILIFMAFVSGGYLIIRKYAKK